MGFWTRTSTIFALGFVLSLPDSSRAQSSISGGVSGVVTDLSGAVMPGVTVKAHDNVRGLTKTTTTNAEGLYQFYFLLPGSYSLSFAHAGFQEATRPVAVSLGPPVSVNIRLDISPQRIKIQVTDQVELVRAENGDVSATMNRTQISQVPNPGNDLTYIVQTAPGMIMDTDQGGGNFSNLGMPGTSNLFTLNGMNDNDFFLNVNNSGALNLSLGSNEIEQASVVSNGYSAQYGGAAGANVNYITKSGTNQFHGNAVYYWNGRVLNANDWFNNANGVVRPLDNANQWAASLGGPIKKDKLFFFFDTEGARLLLPIPAQVVLPSPQFETSTIANIDARFGSNSASDAFYKNIFALYNKAPGSAQTLPGNFSDPLGCGSFVGPNGLGTSVPCAVHFSTTEGRPSSQALISWRTDWNLRDNDQASLLVQYGWGYQATYNDPISPLFDGDSNEPAWQGQLIETHSFASQSANQLLVASSWTGKVIRLANPSKTLAAFPTSLDWFATGSFANLGLIDADLPAGRNATRFQISDDFSKIFGNHKLTFGANFLRAFVTSYDYSYKATGQLIPLTLDAFFQGGVDPNFLHGTDPNQDYTLLNQSFPSRLSQRLTFNRLGFYAQDEWHVRSNLTFTFALRLEDQSNPVCKDRCFARLTGAFDSVSHDPAVPYNEVILLDQKHAFQNLNGPLWSPRLSFAWQPFGVSRSTVVRGGIGIFYDPLPPYILASLSSNPPVINSFTVFGDNLTPGEMTSLFKDASASNSAFLNGFASGQTVSQMRAAIPNFSPVAITVPDNKTFSPQYQKWSLEIEHAFGRNTSSTLGYYGNHGLHELILDPSANAFGFGSFPSGFCTSPPVPPCSDPRFAQVTVITTDGVSNYNGMVVSVDHRFTGSAQGLLQANYTFGHAFDEVSNGGIFGFTLAGSAPFPQDPNSVRGAYGPAEYDVRHSFNANYVWEVPLRTALRGHGPQLLVDGWQLSGTVFARTGFPYTVFDFNESFNLNANNYFNTIYAVPAAPLSGQESCGEGAAIPVAPKPCLPPQVLPGGIPNPNAMFVESGCETGFNLGIAGATAPACTGGKAVQIAQGRNQFRGPRYFNADFAVMKNTKLGRWEKGQIGVGVQFYNLLNHPNFGLPNNDISNPFFGRISYAESPPTTILGSSLGGDASPRMIQLKLQLQF